MKSSVQLPFGKRLFIGIIKFFDKEKGFGYIASNNHGMKHHNRFRNREQAFFIDGFSWTEPIEGRKVVVFQPVIIDNKCRAENVRLLKLETDRDLVLDYYSHDNYISFEEKVKTYWLNFKGGANRFAGYKKYKREYNILSVCGIARYELLNEYVNNYVENRNYEELLAGIDKIINSKKGDKTYYDNLCSNYKNKEAEHSSWKVIFDLLDDSQIIRLIKKHPSVQIFAPDNLLLDNLDFVNGKYVLSRIVRNALNKKNAEKRKREVERLIDCGIPNESRKEMYAIKNKYGGILTLERTTTLNNRIEEETLKIIDAKIKDLDTDSISTFISLDKQICNEFNNLTDKGKHLFISKSKQLYEEKLLHFVESVSSFKWDNLDKIKVKKYILNNEIIKATNINTPKDRLKEEVTKDYWRLFIQTEDSECPFLDHAKFESEYSCLYEHEEHEALLNEIEHKCLEIGSLFCIAKLFEYLNKSLPDNLKPRILALPLDSLLRNIRIIKNFEDNGASILKSIFDKILVEISSNVSSSKKEIKCEIVKFTNIIVSILGENTSMEQICRLPLDFRIEIYKQLHLEVISANDLKSYILAPNTDNNNFDNSLLDTETGKNAVVLILEDCDYSNSTGVKTAINWIQRYVGTEPSGWEENRNWNNRKETFIRCISHSTNECLKLLMWALYFRSAGRRNLLRDLYYLFPTWLQIKVLKKFFNLMTIGKIHSSIQELKNLIGADNHYISVPVEIVLQFLSRKIEDENAKMTDTIMLNIMNKRNDYYDWYLVKDMLNPCNGRKYMDTGNGPTGKSDDFRNFNGKIEKCMVLGKEVFRVSLSRMQLTANNLQPTMYNNTSFDIIREYISITYSNKYKEYIDGANIIYDIDISEESNVRVMAEAYRLKMHDVVYSLHYDFDQRTEKFCCECRTSEKLSSLNGCNKVFLWCRNYPCFVCPPHYHTSAEWEEYTVLDFMRILSIPVDSYHNGKRIVFGHYIELSGYMQRFHELFEHLKCRKCNNLMEPYRIGNFGRYSITEFSCKEKGCSENNNIVYLNNCFNAKCKSIIDSRDSKQCPNNSYICEKCGSCCSNAEYEKRLNRLDMTGGVRSTWLIDAVRNQIGHLEQGIKFCSSCGNKMDGKVCKCGKTYDG